MFTTTDIILAATLKVKGFEMLGLERHGNLGTFKFADVPADFLTDYDLGRVNVEPVSFNNAVKSLTAAARR